MTQDREKRNIRIVAAFLLLLATGLYLTDRAGQLSFARIAMHNAVSPGRTVVLSLAAVGTAAGPSTQEYSTEEIAELQQALLQNELQRRQLLIENARLHNENRDLKRVAEIDGVAGFDLVSFVALKATILSRSVVSDTLREAFIDAGKSNGLKESQLVVQGTGLVIDRGLDYNIEAGQKVAQGRAVIGRIKSVSQWVSLVQPITDKEFSAAVQLVTLAPHGASPGPRGLLEGTGESHCRVTGVPYTSAVSVGDEVFSAEINGVQGPRLYYGRVVRAEFSRGGEWEIQLEPAVRHDELKSVSVVQPILNPKRTSRTAAAQRAATDSRRTGS